MDMKFIKKFIEDLGYKDYAKSSGLSIKEDKYGYYHLIIENLQFKMELTVKKIHTVENTVNFTPNIGVTITAEMIGFLEALRRADTVKLYDDIDRMKGVLYECTKKEAYDLFKTNGYSRDWDDKKKGNIKSFFHYDYIEGDAQYYFKDRTGEYPALELKQSDVLNAMCEGVLEVWKEMTGRDDLYVYDDGDKYGAYICSK